MSSVVISLPKSLVVQSYSQNAQKALSPLNLVRQNADSKDDISEPKSDLDIQKALDHLNQVLNQNNINVSLIVDITKGTKDVLISEMDSGRAIMRFPPEGVVEMAEHARLKNIGFLMDTSL